eukprot:c5529_g1_i1.p1 GENE.c5529_g1_i1~~c5529_g1_i1.p1  ORF type:complete len:150 (-),score=34.97 c5529_g1_i1:69-488(-)
MNEKKSEEIEALLARLRLSQSVSTNQQPINSQSHLSEPAREIPRQNNEISQPVIPTTFLHRPSQPCGKEAHNSNTNFSCWSTQPNQPNYSQQTRTPFEKPRQEVIQTEDQSMDDSEIQFMLEQLQIGSIQHFNHMPYIS